MKRYINPVNLGMAALATFGVCLGIDTIAQAEEMTPPTSQTLLLAQGGGRRIPPSSSPAYDAGVRAQITQLYHLILNRAPDGAGMQFYVDRHYSGWSMEQIRQHMSNSDEARRVRDRAVSESNNNRRDSDRYNNRYNNRDNIRNQITQYYRRYLRRNPDDFGINYYLGRYYNDGWSLDRIQDDLRNSDEAQRVRRNRYNY